MYYIKKGKKVVATNDPDEVTKENFVCEPGAENKVHCKLEKYEFDRETGEKKAVTNQVRADNPGDFERFAPIWKRQGMTITMLHDPREGIQNDVAAKLAKLNADSDENENENQNENENGEKPTEEDWQKTVEAKEMAEKRAAELEAELAEMKAKADAEARAAFEAQERAKAEEEAKAKAEEEARLKAEEEAKAKAEAGSKETKGKTK